MFLFKLNQPPIQRLERNQKEGEEENEVLTEYKRLIALEEKAREEKVGRWAENSVRFNSYLTFCSISFSQNHTLQLYIHS